MAGTITALEVQKRNKDRVNVYLDGEFAFGLVLIDAARLHKGQDLSDNEIRTLKAKDAVEQAYERAVAFLANRPRSAAEIRRNLTDKEVDASAIDEVIERLEARGYVDDAAFARYWVSNRQEFKPRGNRALRFELREKGVDNAIIDEVLADVDRNDAAYRAAQDKARRLQSLDRRSFRDKLGAYLARRGFDYDTIGEVINRLLEERQEGDAGAFVSSQDNVEE